MSKPKLYPSIYFNEDKTMVSAIVTSAEPISEEEFLACLYDLVKEFAKGFNYEDSCQMVEVEGCIDEDYDGSIKH